jgi:hypothetical protein
MNRVVVTKIPHLGSVVLERAHEATNLPGWDGAAWRIALAHAAPSGRRPRMSAPVVARAAEARHLG